MTRQLREFGGGGDLGPAPLKEKVCFFLTSSYFYFYFKEKKVAKIHFWLLKKTKKTDGHKAREGGGLKASGEAAREK